jgi:very-short-patch-repair endonuclease
MRHKSTAGDLARRQYGIVTRQQLLAAGWSASGIARDRQAGRLHEVHAGVYAVGHRALTDRARWLAAVLACKGSVLSHRSAGALWELPIGDNGLTHVIAPTKHRRRRVDSHQGAVADRDRTTRHGIPVTTIARTLVDLSHSLDDESLHRVVREAQFRGVFDEARVKETLTRRPSARLRTYLGVTTLTQTELEDRFLRLCRRHRIPTPATQYGTKPRVDFIWHDQRLVVEVDGWEAHRTRVAFQQDRTTTNALQLQGLVVLRYTHDDVILRPRLVAAQVLSAGNFSSTHSGPSSSRRYGRPPTRT